MKPSIMPECAVEDVLAECALAAHGVVQATPDQFKALRLRPDPATTDPLPAAVLKHAAEQSVVALAAVYQAMHVRGWKSRDCAGWGVIAAPRFLGRAEMAVTISRFAAEGAFAISPHVIPHYSLHAVSGMVSQILKLHGPNFGVGGGSDGAADPFRAAMSLLGEGKVPGVWAVLTGYIPELVPGTPPICCAAVALGLTRSSAAPGAPRLCLTCREIDGAFPLSLEALIRRFCAGTDDGTLPWAIDGGALYFVG